MDPREKRRVLARARPRLPSCRASGVVLLLVFCSPRGVSASTKPEGRHGRAVRVPEKEGKIASVCRFSPTTPRTHAGSARPWHVVRHASARFGRLDSSRGAARAVVEVVAVVAAWWWRCGVAACLRRAASGSRKLGSARPGPRLRLLGRGDATRREPDQSVSQ